MKKINLACLIEDDPIHVFLTQKYVDMIGKVENLMICSNGKEAFDKLSAIITAGDVLPELILLDLNMPIWDGWQFLDEFTKIPVKERVVIYILTSSNNPEDLKRAAEYNLESNYLIKPITLENLKTALESAIDDADRNS